MNGWKWNTNPIKQWTENQTGPEGAMKTNTTLTSLDLRGVYSVKLQYSSFLCSRCFNKQATVSEFWNK